MPARLPVQNKSPFEIDARPLEEMASSHAGLLATSRAFRALKLPDLIAAHLPLKERKRGLNEAQILEALVLLQTAGGDCPEDIKILSSDRCLERGLGFSLPKVTALRSFLERFHDESLEAARLTQIGVRNGNDSAQAETGALAAARRARAVVRS